MDRQEADTEVQNEAARVRGRQKRLWMPDEEVALVSILVEMNETGWKVDTGHKNGYHSYIEKEMAIRIPGCTIKADPHIKSKVKILKTLLGYILEIQKNGSGFGWDDELKMVTGDKDLFQGWAKSRPRAKALFGKPFPHYEKLCEVYLKDRATGSRSRGPGDESLVDLTEDNGTDVDEVQNEYDPNNNHHGSENNNLPRKMRKTKKMDPVEESIMQLSKSINSLIELEKQGAMTTKQLVEQRKNLIPVLKAISGEEARLSTHDIVKIASVIGLDDAKVEIFFNMDDEMKLEYAK